MTFDLIVVGGGHNGLVCAAYAARAGLTVAVLERHGRVGGAAFTEEFHPGFRNSAASYTVSLLEPRIVRELGLAGHGLRIVPRPLDNFVPAVEGPGLELPGDTAARQREIARFSPADAERYPAYVAMLDRVLALVRPFMTEAPVAPFADRGELARALRVALRALGHGPRAIGAALRLFRRSAGRLLDDHFETGLLKGALGFDSIVGHCASPYAASSGYLLLHHALGELDGRPGAWGHAIGGMGAISDALASAARAAGVSIFTDEAVTAIRPVTASESLAANETLAASETLAANETEAAVRPVTPAFTVETTRRTLSSRFVAGAIHPRTLLLELLDGGALPAPFRRRIEQWQSESASFRINVALSELPDFRCLPGRTAAPHHGAGILIAPSLGYLDRAWRDAEASGYSARPVVELVIPSIVDPTLAPAGQHVASLFCQHFRYALPAGRSWDAERDAAVARIVATVDDYAPNFGRSIVALKASSPLDLERRFGLVGGDIFHGAMIPGQLYHRRPARGAARYRMPVPGLYLCASGAHPGGGVSGLPGLNAARRIVADATTRRR